MCGFGADLQVVFGGPYSTREIWDRKRVKAFKEIGAEKADYINAKIAVLNPELVDPKDLEFYKRVLAT